MGWWCPSKSLFLLGMSLVLVTGESLAEDNPPIVQTAQGMIQGTYGTSRQGRQYNAFMGIPFAQKPERFEIAQPVADWIGAKDASKYGSNCPQVLPGTTTVIGDEDCLFVNIFTPNITGNQSVVIFIHGGGFQFGNSDENGANYFMDEDVVLVTLNYRLAAYGFLSSGDDILPGNLGLKDQLLALKWVKQNIQAFGGDPRRTTLAGQSAGSASANFHILSNASKGLFRNAILQSGTALSKWAFKEDPKKPAFKLAEKLGCPTDSAGLKKCLKAKDVKEVLLKSLPERPIIESTCVFAPTVEPEGPNAFLTERPDVLYKEGRFRKVRTVMTVTEKEGLLISAAALVKNETLLKELNESFNELAPTMFLYDEPWISQEAKDLISKRIRKFYFDERDISNETLDDLVDLFSDSQFVYSQRNTALLHARRARVFTLVMAYNGLPWSQIMELGYEHPMGMTHADDLPLAFNALKYPPFEAGSEAENASIYFVKMVVAMSRTGNPNFYDGFDGWKSVRKTQIESGDLKWLYFKSLDEFPSMRVDPIGDRMKFWDKVDKKIQAQRQKSQGAPETQTQEETQTEKPKEEL